MDKYLKRSGFSEQNFFVLMRIYQTKSDLVNRCFKLNGPLQFGIGLLIKQFRQLYFVSVAFTKLQLTPFLRKISFSILTVTMAKIKHFND